VYRWLKTNISACNETVLLFGVRGLLKSKQSGSAGSGPASRCCVCIRIHASAPIPSPPPFTFISCRAGLL